MDDRELLELAAKAVGYRTGHKRNRERLEMDPPIMAMVVRDADGELISTGWNPLDDDGQALRLAVVLGIKFRWHAVLNQALAWPPGDSFEVRENGESHGGDPYAATRRAIVRAAAEIGRAMP